MRSGFSSITSVQSVFNNAWDILYEKRLPVDVRKLPLKTPQVVQVLERMTKLIFAGQWRGELQIHGTKCGICLAVPNCPRTVTIGILGD